MAGDDGGPVVTGNRGVRSADRGQVLWRFRGYGLPYLGMFCLGLGLRICEMAADLAAPWPIAAVVDRVLGAASAHNPLTHLLGVFGTGKATMLATAAGAVVVTATVSGAFDYAGDRVMNGVGERMSVAIRSDAYGHLQRLPMSYHDRQAVGESTSRIITDCARIKDSLVALFATLLPGMLSVGSFAIALLWLDWRFGLIGIGCIPLVYVIGVHNRRLGHRAARREREAEGRLAAQVTETLHGIRTVHSFGRQDLHDHRFARESERALQAGLATTRVQALRVPLLELATAGGTALLLWIGGSGVLNHWWSVGQLVVAVSYLNSMVSPIKSLSRLSVTFAQGQASGERILGILDEPRSPTRSDAGLPVRTAGRIDFRCVSMAYGSRPALRDLDLTVLPGERVALTGPNGAGKSTLLRVVNGEIEPEGAAIKRFDGRIAYLSQRLDLLDLDRTVAQNLADFAPGMPEAQRMNLLARFLFRGSRIHLPVGVLSGGERLRASLACVLYAEPAPQLLLLDEPTNNLDLVSVGQLESALTAYEGAFVVISHDERFLAEIKVNRWLRFSGGRLVETGAPDGD